MPTMPKKDGLFVITGFTMLSEAQSAECIVGNIADATEAAHVISILKADVMMRDDAALYGTTVDELRNELEQADAANMRLHAKINELADGIERRDTEIFDLKKRLETHDMRNRELKNENAELNLALGEELKRVASIAADRDELQNEITRLRDSLVGGAVDLQNKYDAVLAQSEKRRKEIEEKRHTIDGDSMLLNMLRMRRVVLEYSSPLDEGSRSMTFHADYVQRGDDGLMVVGRNDVTGMAVRFYKKQIRNVTEIDEKA